MVLFLGTLTTLSRYFIKPKAKSSLAGDSPLFSF